MRAQKPLSNAIKRQIGSRIRQLRKNRGLGLERLANEAGMSAGTLGAIERGQSEPTLGTLLRLVKALDVESVEGLLGPMPPALPSRYLSQGLGVDE